MTIIKQLINFTQKAEDYLNKGVFVSYDGICFPKRIAESEFYYRLEERLNDPEKAKLIADSFKNHLESNLTSYERALLKDWVVKNAWFIGVIPIAEQNNDQLEMPILQIFQTHSRQICLFFKEIRVKESLSQFPLNKDPKDPKNIVIITTTSGGGHKSVADALEHILQNFPNKYKVTVVNFSDVARLSDPLYRLSGLITTEETYDRVFQQYGDVKLFYKLQQIAAQLPQFVPNTSMQDLKHAVRRLNADLILTTCSFSKRDLALSSALGVPLRFVHCDYGLHPSLTTLIPRVNPQIIRLWLPEKNPHILGFTETLLKPKLFNELYPTQSPQQIHEWVEECKKNVLEYSGFPVRSAFQKETDPNVLNEIRKRFQIPEGAQVIVIQMGRQGVATLIDIIKCLNESNTPYSHPLYIAALCGTNQSMRNQLINYLNDDPQRNHPQIEFKILPLLDQNIVADYLKIAAVQIMKPGGGATSEALQMGIKTLILHSSLYPWENCNKEQMIHYGNGMEVPSPQMIPNYLKQLLALPKRTQYRPIDAQETVPRLVDEAIGTFEVFKATVLKD